MVDSLHFYIVRTQINKDGWRISTSSHLKADMFAAVRCDPLAVKLASETSGVREDQVQILSQTSGQACKQNPP